MLIGFEHLSRQSGGLGRPVVLLLDPGGLDAPKRASNKPRVPARSGNLSSRLARIGKPIFLEPQKSAITRLKKLKIIAGRHRRSKQTGKPDAWLSALQIRSVISQANPVGSQSYAI